MIIDTEKLNRLFASDVSSDRVAAETDTAKMQYYNYKHGKVPLESMQLGYAMKLQQLQEKLEKEMELKMELNNVKIKGLKKAVSEFNKWTGAARIYFDKEGLEVWTNVYSGPGEWDEYSNEAISEVIEKGTHTMESGWNKTTMAEVENRCLTIIQN